MIQAKPLQNVVPPCIGGLVNTAFGAVCQDYYHRLLGGRSGIVNRPPGVADSAIVINGKRLVRSLGRIVGSAGRTGRIGRDYLHPSVVFKIRCPVLHPFHHEVVHIVPRQTVELRDTTPVLSPLRVERLGDFCEQLVFRGEAPQMIQGPMLRRV